MLDSSSLRSVLTLLSVASVVGCGLRSDPFAPDSLVSDDGNDSDDPGDPNGPGTCVDPLPIPFSPTTLRGELSGRGFSEGWCGSDGGAEDVYVLRPDQNADVTIAVDPGETEFTPTLRVIEDGCDPGDGFTKVCARDIIDQPYHFLARAGSVYSIMIDSRDGAEGKYAFTVDFGEPAEAQCGVHPEVIQQVPGSAFLWNNEFSQGQGHVDSYCGGPGRENMFRLRATYPGNAFARVETSGAFAPLISFRRGCGSISEIDCVTGPAGGIAELGFFIEQPGDYFLVVDQAEIGSGGYQLRVDFE
ncbi:MAG: hypothetical protein KDK70_14530 [Myxococcales bacterium]|nr:hypothetical protein [Myxococcales bacterium]